MASYHVLLPILVFFGVGTIFITTFVVVDTTGASPQATAGPDTTTLTSTGITPTTTPTPVCPSATIVFTNITGNPILVENGWFIGESFYGLNNNLVFSSLPTLSYPTLPTSPITVTAATVYMGELLLSVDGVGALFGVNSDIIGMLPGGNITGYGLFGGFLYGQVNSAIMYKINPLSASIYDSIVLEQELYSIAVNQVTSNAYVLLKSGQVRHINLITGETSVTCISTSSLKSIAFDSSGRLWGSQGDTIIRYPTEPI
jgi:hypothetical protein